MNLFGCPAADGVAAREKNLQHAKDACIVDFDAGIANLTGGDGQGKPLE